MVVCIAVLCFIPYTMEVKIDNHLKILNLNENSDSFVQQYLKNLIQNEEYTFYSVDKKLFSGGNFFGLIYEVNIKGETEKESKEKNLIVKIIPPDEQMTMLSLSDAYKK